MDNVVNIWLIGMLITSMLCLPFLHAFRNHYQDIIPIILVASAIWPILVLILIYGFVVAFIELVQSMSGSD